MKTILIATDFSKASRNACLYGVQLAKAMNANIILFTAYRVSHNTAAVNMRVSDYDVMKQTQNKLFGEAGIIAYGEGVHIETVCEEGLAEQSILAVANEKAADLIVVGIAGSHIIKKLFGSTTSSLIKNANIPVLVIPEKAIFSKPKTLLYASDVFLDTIIQPIDQIQWITDFFKSKLYVVRNVKDDYEKLLEEVNVPHRLRAELKIINTTFQFPVNKNVSDGLNDFISELPVDLLIIKPGRYEWMERLFKNNDSKDRVSHAHIPLLVLPELTEKRSELLPLVNTEDKSKIRLGNNSVRAQITRFLSKGFDLIASKFHPSLK